MARAAPSACTHDRQRRLRAGLEQVGASTAVDAAAPAAGERKARDRVCREQALELCSWPENYGGKDRQPWRFRAKHTLGL